MADRPILFSAPMIVALLAGRKTQTRRIVKPQPPIGWNRHCWYTAPSYGWTDEESPTSKWHVAKLLAQPGDRLWVREAWRTFVSLDATPPRDIWSPHARRGAGIYYEADAYGLSVTADGDRYFGERESKLPFGKLRPGMFMPRWASRLTLAVEDVRVERLQDISEEDAIAEGLFRTSIGDGYPDRFTPGKAEWGDIVDCSVKSWKDPRAAYSVLWNQINGDGAWSENPYVTAYTFTVHHTNIDAMKEAA